MKSNEKKEFNRKVKKNVETLGKAKKWLKEMMFDKENDWASQKSAHQALRFIELAEYEMWNLQWWENRKQRELYLEAEKEIA